MQLAWRADYARLRLHLRTNRLSGRSVIDRQPGPKYLGLGCTALVSRFASCVGHYLVTYLGR